MLTWRIKINEFFQKLDGRSSKEKNAITIYANKILNPDESRRTKHIVGMHGIEILLNFGDFSTPYQKDKMVEIIINSPIFSLGIGFRFKSNTITLGSKFVGHYFYWLRTGIQHTGKQLGKLRFIV